LSTKRLHHFGRRSVGLGHRVRRQSPPLTTALVYVTSPTPLNATEMTALRDLSLDLAFVEGVTAVASPFTLRWPPTPEGPSGIPVFATRIAPEFAGNLTSFDALETGFPTFLNNNLTSILLSVSVNTDEATIADAMTGIQAELDRSTSSR